MRKILVFLAAFAFLGTACGSDSDNKADTVEGGSGTASAPSDDDGGDLESKLLTAADLPAGFEAGEPSDGTDDEDEEESSDSGCPEIDALDDDPAEEEIEIEFERSDEESETGQFVNQGIERYESDDDADADFDKAVAAFQKCKTFSTTEDDGTKITGTFTPLSFPKLEDDTFAVRMELNYTSEGESITLEGAMAAVRSGDLVTLLMNLNFGDGGLTAADFESIVRKAAAKL